MRSTPPHDRTKIRSTLTNTAHCPRFRVSTIVVIALLINLNVSRLTSRTAGLGNSRTQRMLSKVGTANLASGGRVTTAAAQQGDSQCVSQHKTDTPTAQCQTFCNVQYKKFHCAWCKCRACEFCPKGGEAIEEASKPAPTNMPAGLNASTDPVITATKTSLSTSSAPPTDFASDATNPVAGNTTSSASTPEQPLAASAAPLTNESSLATPLESPLSFNGTASISTDTAVDEETDSYATRYESSDEPIPRPSAADDQIGGTATVPTEASESALPPRGEVELASAAGAVSGAGADSTTADSAEHEDEDESYDEDDELDDEDADYDDEDAGAGDDDDADSKEFEARPESELVGDRLLTTSEL